jgi:hypothetical protein
MYISIWLSFTTRRSSFGYANTESHDFNTICNAKTSWPRHILVLPLSLAGAFYYTSTPENRVPHYVLPLTNPEPRKSENNQHAMQCHSTISPSHKSEWSMKNLPGHFLRPSHASHPGPHLLCSDLGLLDNDDGIVLFSISSGAGDVDADH